MIADTSAEAFLGLVGARKGHFALESGHHSSQWLDLDALFVESERVMPFVSALAEALRPYRVDAVCGPLLGGAFLAQLIAHRLEKEFCFTERAIPGKAVGLYQATYKLPVAFRKRTSGQRVAIVDDVMSAGSALRGTYTELQSHGAEPVVAGALLMLGSKGEDFFRKHSVPIQAVAREVFDLWPPGECPLCISGVPLA